MLLECLAGGALIGWGVNRQRHSRKKRLIHILQEGELQESEQDSQQLTRTSALNSWNEFETLSQANRHLALMTGAVGLAAGGAILSPALGLLSVPIVLYGTYKLHLRSVNSLVNECKFNVSALTSLFILGGLARGYYVPISLASFFYSLSCNLLLRIRNDSSTSFVDVYKQFPRHVHIVAKDGQPSLRLLSEVAEGDRVVVRSGEVIPVDGHIVAGTAAIDQHLLTGESQPVERGDGEAVFALTIVLSGAITVAVERTGAATSAAQIGQLLNQTIDYKSTVQLRAEDIADKTALPTFLLSALAFPFFGLTGTLATLNAHPKFKMSLVAPISMMNILKVAMDEGCFIKDGRSLDLLDQVDTVVFDKTGTLTIEQPHVARVDTFNGYDADSVLMLAAAAESQQTHPIAQAICAAATEQGLAWPAVDDGAYRMGYGVKVQIADKVVHVGSLRFLQEEGIATPAALMDSVACCHEQGHSAVVVAVDERLVGAIELHATMRPEAQQIIDALKQRGIGSIYIISGDHETPTRKLAETLGIDGYFAQTLPEEKAELIRRLQKEGKFICYVGDGINDAIALKQAQVSVSLHGASSIAQDTADIILLDATLRNLVKVFDFGDHFKARTQTAFAATFAPALFAMGGVFLLNFGLWQTILLNQVGMIGGLIPALWPLTAPEQDADRFSPIAPAPKEVRCVNSRPFVGEPMLAQAGLADSS